MSQYDLHMQALENVRRQVEVDPHVIALLLSGSLSYGTVWEKSDIDLTLIVRDGDEPPKGTSDYCLDENGIEVHLAVCDISHFKRTMTGNFGGDWVHSYYGHGRLVFSKDDSLYDFFEENKAVGSNDAAMSFIDKSEILIVSMNRAEKWITVFHDTLYAQRFMVDCALYAASLVVLTHREDPNREAILRAMELEPEFMKPLYERAISTKMTEEQISEDIKKYDDFLIKHMAWWGNPITDYLSDGVPRRVSEIIKHFGVSGMFYPLSYMANKGILQRVTQPSRVFKHSRFTLEEVSYMYLKEE